MLKTSFLLGLAAFVFPATLWADEEKRCGWYMNPTPANHWLDDADQTWILSVQGGYQVWNSVELEEDSFDFSDEWVSSNGAPGHSYYGHGCACIAGTFDRDTRQVLSIATLTSLPLQTCRSDPNLPEEPRYATE